MITLMLWIGLAWAQDAPECELASELSSDTLSVAWVSPMNKRVGANGWFEVVPTTQLRSWAASNGRAVGPMLKAVGARKKADEPKRPWKVTIFEIEGDLLCMSDTEGSLPVYEARWRDVARRGFCLLPAERFVAEG